MNTNEYGQVTFDTREMITMLYAGQSIDGYSVSDPNELSMHNKNAILFEIDALHLTVTPQTSAVEYHAEQSNKWQMPQSYQQLDVEHHLSQRLVAKGFTDVKYTQRLIEELSEYHKRDMMNILRFLHYLMDTCKQHNVVTGIGRGSSVSSLVLHLLDVHHIDPVKYNLDYKEFLR